MLLLVTVAAPAGLRAAFANVKWDLGGAAAVYNTNGRVVLTDANNNRFGGAFNPCPLDINQDFDLTFGMNFGVNACGADGINFVLKPNSGGQAGSDPGRRAFDGIANALAVAFDTYSNMTAPYSDPPYDSLGIEVSAGVQNAGPSACGDSGVVAGPTGCGRPTISSSAFNIKDGADHTVRITWNAATRRISIYVDLDPTPRAQWDLPAGYISSIFGGNSTLYWGFTAATGGWSNYHQVGLISGTVNNGSRDVTTFTCTAATPVPGATNTPLVVPTSACGTPTPMPTFTYSPTPAPPTATFTNSPTPYPPGCGPPVFQEAKVLASGCLGSTGTVTTGSYSFATQPNQLLVLRMITSSNGGSPSAVTFGGVPMSLFAASLVGQSNDRHMWTYYLASPPTSGTVSFSYPNANCSWNIVTELYRNVDVANPVSGSTATSEGNAGGSSPFPFSFNYTTTGSASLVSVFMTSDQAAGAPPTSVAPQVDLNLNSQGPASVDGGGSEGCSGYYYTVNGPGTYSFDYHGTQGGRWWDAQPMEIRGTLCGTPTATATPSASPSNSPSPSVTLTRSPTASPSSTRTASPTFSPTISPTVAGTLTDTPTHSPSSTRTLSVTPTSTPTATPSLTATPTASPSVTQSNTFTGTPSFSFTPTPTPSATQSNTFTATATRTATLTATPTATQTNTFTATATLTVSPTISPTFTITATFTVSPTITTTSDRFYQSDRLVTLRGLFPNPFADHLGVYYTLRVDADIDFSVYNVAGEPIWKVHTRGKAGKNLLEWKGENDAGGRCASGVYILRLEAAGVDRTTDGFWERAAISR